jgi:hypothetical protein
LNGQELCSTILKTFLASGAAVAGAMAAIPYLMKLPHSAGGKFTGIMILLCIFGMIYIAASFIVKAAELREFLSILKRRGKKS